MLDDEKLIPELRVWRDLNSESFSINAWTMASGNIKLAIGYSFLYSPDFIEYEGCVFLKDHFNVPNFEDWKLAEYVFNYAQIESVINHIHIPDLFPMDNEDINIDQIRYLGTKLCEIYSAKLKLEFPNKIFTVSFNGNEELEDLLDYELTFYQEANTARKLR